MRATVRDVARRAGVSPKTVSNVVNSTVTVSPATRRRVEEALAELDYVPNLSARGLRNGRTGVIACALPDLGSSYFAELAHHFVTAARQRGLSVQIEETGGADRERQLLSRARAQLIDGLVLNPALLETSAVQLGVALPPVVLIGEVQQPLVDRVWHDNVAASRAMTTLLLEEGHRRIAVLGVLDSETSRQRVQGYQEAMDAAGVPQSADLVIPAPQWSLAGGAEAIRRHLGERHQLPEAIFCVTDELAIGVLSSLSVAGHRVPDDVSVVGYDDVLAAAYTLPPLTTVRIDRADVAVAALDLLTQRIADDERPPSSVRLSHSLIRRASTRARR